MVRKCMIHSCPSRQRDNVSFHFLPKDATMKQKWVNAIRDWEPNGNFNFETGQICSNHFHIDDYCHYISGKRLKATAVPSIHLASGDGSASQYNPSEDDSTSSTSFDNRYPKSDVVVRQIRKLTEGVDFLSNFNPETSTREQRKMSRKYYAPTTARKNMYDDKGRFLVDGADVCDCLDETCEGCHFPCPNCKSAKCGPQCRVHRKWTYESIEHDGKDMIIDNKYTDQQSK